MQLVDVNVLVYAHREDTPDHDRFLSWLENWIDSDAAFGMSDLVLSGFLRIVTHPRVFRRPTPIKVALEFVDSIRQRPNCVPIKPGPRHWDIFERLCRSSAAKGNLVPDAFLAAIAIESGSEWVTTDRDYSRFDGLRWRHPFD